ncbi:MAG: hypothetical protein Q7T87_05400 [Polaromonas sp.]|nr:hypothetical protein [Polaromonas sp.]
MALLGAPGTGKTRLAQALHAHLSHAIGKTTLVIDDDPGPLPALSDPNLLPGVATPAHRPSYDLVLLMGLDLDLPGDVTRQSTADADQAIRSALHQQGIGFKVVYGQGDERLRSALRAMPAVFQPETGIAQAPSGIGATNEAIRREIMQPSPRWVWTCDKCSDPVCEHQLFTRLQAARAT